MIAPNEFPGSGPERDPEPEAEHAKACTPNKFAPANQFSVCVKGDKVLVHNILVRDPIALSHDDATNLGMWLLAMSLQSNLPAVDRAVKAIKEIVEGK